MTKDGSFSLKSNYFNETFHSGSGALNEALTKFICPSQIEIFKEESTIRILDVCFGLGYNSAALLDALQQTSIKAKWLGLEIDPRPLDLALKEKDFQNLWSTNILSILQSLRKHSQWNNDWSEGLLLWGDARKMIKAISKTWKADLVFLDAFSPTHCPELWTEEFLSKLAKLLSPGGRIITYCRAAAVRASLRRSGLQIFSIKPSQFTQNNWSEGTIAISSDNKNVNNAKDQPWQLLSPMEEEHLLTRAATPYRDLSGADKPCEIIDRRKIEQFHSNLKVTSDWRRRWFN